MVLLILLTIFSCALVVVGSAYLWDRRQKLFFRHKNVPYVSSSIFGGSLRDVLLLRQSVADAMLDLYTKASEKDVPFVGARLLFKNCLVVRDLELVKRVLVQDFNHFSNRSAAADFHHDPFGGYNLFLLKNPEWHELRRKITPVFTGSRMKLFFEDINGIGEKLHKKILMDIPIDKVVSLKDLNGAFSTDVYASCSFGIEVNFIERPESEFGTTAMEMFNFKAARALEFGSNFVFPELSKFRKTFFFSKEGSVYLKEVLSAVLKERVDKLIRRNDLMDVIMKIKSGQETDSVTKYSDDMLLAQSVIFFVAGFETTSTALTHTLYELARNPDVQSKVKQEIATHLERYGKITYENLSELKYMMMVCQEVFRLYPAFSFLNRECTPSNGEKSYSLQPYMDFDIPAGLPIYIPIYALHRDEKYFPDPEKFDPDRFSAENFARIPKGAYLPFGSGPRQCLAERLAYMVMKVGLFNVLQDYSVEKCEKTPEQVRPHNLVVLMVPDKKIYVRLRKDEDKRLS